MEYSLGDPVRDIHQRFEFYNHAIYLNALAAQPNFDVQSASTAVSIFGGGFASLCQAGSGCGPRVSITLGAVMSLSLCASCRQRGALFAVYVVFGAGLHQL